jgi:hypothetical protein
MVLRAYLEISRPLDISVIMGIFRDNRRQYSNSGHWKIKSLTSEQQISFVLHAYKISNPFRILSCSQTLHFSYLSLQKKKIRAIE